MSQTSIDGKEVVGNRTQQHIQEYKKQKESKDSTIAKLAVDIVSKKQLTLTDELPSDGSLSGVYDMCVETQRTRDESNKKENKYKPVNRSEHPTTNQAGW